MVSSAIWAVVVLYLLWRSERLGKEYLSKLDPLNKVQYDELKAKIASNQSDLETKLTQIQTQVNSLSIQREID